MQLLAQLYGGEIPFGAGGWRAAPAAFEALERTAAPSRLLDGVVTAPRFVQWVTNSIFVTRVPPRFVVTAGAHLGRVLVSVTRRALPIPKGHDGPPGGSAPPPWAFLLYPSPAPRDKGELRMPSSA